MLIIVAVPRPHVGLPSRRPATGHFSAVVSAVMPATITEFAKPLPLQYENVAGAGVQLG
jgi:hypothetical protein